MSRPVLLAAAFALAAAGQAAAAERSFTITSFDRIRVDGPHKVRLTTGVAPFARASGDSAGLDRLSLSVEGRTLVVRNNPSAWGGYPGRPVGPVEIAVGTHDLSAAWLNGSGSLAIDKVRGLSFDLAVHGSGSASLANAAVDQLKVAANGVGSIAVAGKAPKLTASVRGTSTLDASGLDSKDAVVTVEGPSAVRLSASNSAKIAAFGNSTVEVSGKPACTVNAQGSATVTGC